MNTCTKAPDLAPHEGSWVITNVHDKQVETFSRATADYCAQLGLRVETIGAYLGRLNRELKAKP